MFKRKQKQRSRFDRKIDVEEVYVDKNGNKWYAYVNPMTIPAKRAIAAEIATRFAEMNLTKASFKVLVERIQRMVGRVQPWICYSIYWFSVPTIVFFGKLTSLFIL